MHLEARIRGALLGGDDDFEAAESLAAVARDALDADELREWEQLPPGDAIKTTRIGDVPPR